jgi:hypothetical protein
MKMMLKKNFWGGLIIAILSVSGISVDNTTVYASPIPARIGGTVTVDGVLLTQATDSGYTIVVTKPDGSEYNPIVQDIDGLNSLNYYNINIPIWDSVSQPGGAQPGESALIHVYKEGLELLVTSPSSGLLIVGEAGSKNPVPVQVQTSQASIDPPAGPRVIHRETVQDIESAPVNLGSVATGGNSIGLAINFPSFTSPVDIWVAVQLPGGSLFFLDSAHSLTLNQAPYEIGATKASASTIVEEFEICSLSEGSLLPEGLWAVYWLIAPSNGGNIDLIDFDKGPYELDSYAFDLHCK